jgi:hypothetical protein
MARWLDGWMAGLSFKSLNKEMQQWIWIWGDLAYVLATMLEEDMASLRWDGVDAAMDRLGCQNKCR